MSKPHQPDPIPYASPAPPAPPPAPVAVTRRQLVIVAAVFLCGLVLAAGAVIAYMEHARSRDLRIVELTADHKASKDALMTVRSKAFGDALDLELEHKRDDVALGRLADDVAKAWLDERSAWVELRQAQGFNDSLPSAQDVAAYRQDFIDIAHHVAK